MKKTFNKISGKIDSRCPWQDVMSNTDEQGKLRPLVCNEIHIQRVINSVSEAGESLEIQQERVWACQITK